MNKLGNISAEGGLESKLDQYEGVMRSTVDILEDIQKILHMKKFAVIQLII